MPDWFQNLSISPQLRGNLMATGALLVALWVLRWLTLTLVYRRVADPESRYRWRKAASYVTATIGILAVGRIWIAGLRDVTTFLGLLSAGLAIALKDLIANLAGWGFVVWRRPFEVGDRIQIGPHAGDVIDLRLFQFSLLEIGGWVDADQSTGRMIHVPNGLVLTQPLINYTRGFQHIWEELGVLVTFESDWQAAKQVLLEITQRHAENVTEEAARQIRQASQRFMIRLGTLAPTVYTSVKDSGVLLTSRFLCDPRQRRGVTQSIWEDVLRAFGSRDDIDFAYPTTRFYDNPREGKRGTGEPAAGAPA